MSISTYRSQRDRLTKELSVLRGKLATENSRVSDDRAKARRAARAMRRATSSSAQTMSRDVDRHEKSASQHEGSAARLEGQIATKVKALSTAETNLERAEAEQRKKDDRAQEKRRKDELAHVRRLESERRSNQVWPTGLRARSIDVPITVGRVGNGTRPTYDVCLSFAGEQRGYVELVATDLKRSGLRVFYDQDEEVLTELWGKDLTETLDYVYRLASRFCVMFISAEYADKEWTRHERRSALDRAVREEDDYLLPVRFDDTNLPGLRPSVAYLDLREIAPATLADFIRGKVLPDDE